MRFNIKVNLVVSFSLLISHFKVLHAAIRHKPEAELVTLSEKEL